MTNAETNTDATVAEPGAHAAPETAPSKKGATRKKGAPGSQKTGKGGKAKAAATKNQAKAGKNAAKPGRNKEASTPRAESKGAKIIAMIGRVNGATLTEIMKETGWQAHSVRGFISTATKKHQFKIESAKTDAGDRVYKIVK